MVASLFGQYDESILYWEPDQVLQGDTVNIYYNLTEGSLPNNVNPVQLHMGHNDWTGVVDQYTMTDIGDGWWKYHHSVPEDAASINFVFRNVAGTEWDNNGGNDYHIPVIKPGMWTPFTPGPNDTIRIRYPNTTATNMWWGVNSWSAPLADYQPPNTIDADPGLSVESTMNGPNQDGEYWIDIGPFNKPQQVVTVVDFVFNWNGRQNWDNNSGGDYHFPISFDPGPDDPSVTFENITDGQAVMSEQLIQVSSQDAAYIEILIDGVTKHITGGGNFDITINTDDLGLGKHQLVAFAKHANNRVMMDVKTIFKSPQIVEAPFPAGDVLGAHDRGDGTVTFSLLAPGKAFVSIVGDFNNWDATAGLMKYDPAKDIFWLNVALADGSHEYIFSLNGEKLVGDPFATDVNWTDENGNEHWAAHNQKSIVHVGQPEFQWTDDGFVKPPLKDLIIYETLIRDFTPSGDLAGLTGKLDYLKRLGINAIELLPPTEFPGESSWGYNPAFFMALESTYGTPDDMKHFVNEAHKRGIAVLVDLVFNHADGSSPYEQMYGNDYSNSPFMHAESNAWGFPDFDHGKVGTQELTKRTVRHWISEYHVDGFRYDHTPGVGWRGTAEFGVSYFSNEAKNENPETYQIAEHFYHDIWDLIDATAIQSHWHDAFHDQMKANLRQGSFEGSTYGDMYKTAQGIDYSFDGFKNTEACINYVESHDEQRVIFEAQTNGLSYAQAVKKAELAAEVLLTSSGVPMLYMGAELGMDTERTLDHNPVRWFYLDVPDLAKLHQKYKDLIWLRKRYEAFRSENIDVVYRSNTRRVLVHHRTADGEPSAVVAINFNSHDQVIDLNFPESGQWWEYLSGEILNLSGTTQSGYTIPASTARIFVNEKQWVDVDNNVTLPTEYALYQAYPNPFNPSTTVRFDLPEATEVHVNIYDIRGRLIWSNEGMSYEAGKHQVSWNGNSLNQEQQATGVYILELRTPDFREVQKLTLIR